MESLQIAINAVVPFMCYLGYGYIAKRLGWVTESFMQSLNKCCFKAFFPLLTFYNVVGIEGSTTFGARMLIVSVGSILAVIGVMVAVAPRFIKERSKAGVFIQSVYRSNFVTFAIPLASTLSGDEALAVVTFVMMGVITTYNITAVIVLELFNDNHQQGQKMEWKKTIISIITNPLIDGALIGLVFKSLHLTVPALLMTPLSNFAKMATTLSMFVLGGTIHFSAIKNNFKILSVGLLLKLIVLPALSIPVSLALGLTVPERVVYLAIFCTPIATSAFAMAQNMGGDGELAGQFVMLSSVFSLVTIFFWSFILTYVGYI